MSKTAEYVFPEDVLKSLYSLPGADPSEVKTMYKTLVAARKEEVMADVMALAALVATDMITESNADLDREQNEIDALQAHLNARSAELKTRRDELARFGNVSAFSAMALSNEVKKGVDFRESYAELPSASLDLSFFAARANTAVENRSGDDETQNNIRAHIENMTGAGVFLSTCISRLLVRLSDESPPLDRYFGIDAENIQFYGTGDDEPDFEKLRKEVDLYGVGEKSVKAFFELFARLGENDPDLIAYMQDPSAYKPQQKSEKPKPELTEQQMRLDDFDFSNMPEGTIELVSFVGMERYTKREALRDYIISLSGFTKISASRVVHMIDVFHTKQFDQRYPQEYFTLDPLDETVHFKGTTDVPDFKKLAAEIDLSGINHDTAKRLFMFFGDVIAKQQESAVEK